MWPSQRHLQVLASMESKGKFRLRIPNGPDYGAHSISGWKLYNVYIFCLKMRRMREMPEKFHIIVHEPEMVNVCFWYVLVSCPFGTFFSYLPM